MAMEKPPYIKLYELTIDEPKTHILFPSMEQTDIVVDHMISKLLESGVILDEHNIHINERVMFLDEKIFIKEIEEMQDSDTDFLNTLNLYIKTKEQY